MRLTSTIPWGAFSEKHKEYIKNALKYRHLVAEGAVRSGKTIDHCIIAAMYLEISKDKFHLASGSSMPNAKLNIGECNGFGLEHLFRGRCRWGKYKSNEALYIRTQTGEKIVIFTGGGKADSYKSILGNSYGLWIAAEINEHYDCEDSRTSFIKVAMARQIAAKHPFSLWDLNPSDPNSSIYSDYIDRFLEFDWYCYRHFTVHDNATMTPERIKELKESYVEGTVWYRRDILGERAIAVGRIFPYFSDDPKPFLFSGKELAKKKPTFSHLIIGVDFGDSGSKYSFCLSGFMESWKKMKALENGGVEKQEGLDTNILCREFIRFYRLCIEKWGRIEWIFCDSANNTLINTLRSACDAAGLPYTNIVGVKKNEIADRPPAVDILLLTGRLEISDECTDTIKALNNLVWDKKEPNIPEDKNIGNINDYWDAFCYTFITHTSYIELRR